MFLHLVKPLTDDELARIRAIAAEGPFVASGGTAPGLAEAGVKRNEQLATNTKEDKSFTEIVRGALGRRTRRCARPVRASAAETASATE